MYGGRSGGRGTEREEGKKISRSNLFGIFERIIANYLFITLVKFSLGRLMEYHVLSTLD